MDVSDSGGKKVHQDHPWKEIRILFAMFGLEALRLEVENSRGIQYVCTFRLRHAFSAVKASLRLKPKKRDLSIQVNIDTRKLDPFAKMSGK